MRIECGPGRPLAQQAAADRAIKLPMADCRLPIQAQRECILNFSFGAAQASLCYAVAPQ
jgi:hypothetical protein